MAAAHTPELNRLEIKWSISNSIAEHNYRHNQTSPAANVLTELLSRNLVDKKHIEESIMPWAALTLKFLTCVLLTLYY